MKLFREQLCLWSSITTEAVNKDLSRFLAMCHVVLCHADVAAVRGALPRWIFPSGCCPCCTFSCRLWYRASYFPKNVFSYWGSKLCWSLRRTVFASICFLLCCAPYDGTCTSASRLSRAKSSSPIKSYFSLRRSSCSNICKAAKNISSSSHITSYFSLRRSSCWYVCEAAKNISSSISLSVRAIAMMESAIQQHVLCVLLRNFTSSTWIIVQCSL